ncbi:MAG: hypothetical protein Q7T37_00165 [bacterium]|nr:hypothetical protein [bacterium]MDO8742735.1 hypothetical protein [bacterium]
MKIIRSVVSLFTLTYELKSSVERLRSRFEALVQAHATIQGSDLSGCYALDLSTSRGKCKKYSEHINWWNTRYGLILCAVIGSKKVPIAVLGFEGGLKDLTVHRLRRVNGATEYLDGVHWERLLYSVLIEIRNDFAGTIGHRCLRVCPPERSFYNPYTNQDFGDSMSLEEIKAFQEDLHVQHEVIPEELGFRRRGPLSILERC